jgi:hypothetical protein
MINRAIAIAVLALLVRIGACAYGISFLNGVLILWISSSGISRWQPSTIKQSALIVASIRRHFSEKT